MKRILFERKGKSIQNMILIIMGLLLSIVMMIIPIVKVEFDIVLYAIFYLFSLVVVGACIGLIKRGVLSNLIFTDDGIIYRKHIKELHYIKWINVKRSETTKLNYIPVVMIAIEGYDEYTKEFVTLYIESNRETKDIISHMLAQSNKKS